MKKVFGALSAIVITALLFQSTASLAAPDNNQNIVPKVSSNMQKSEKLIKDLMKQTDSDKIKKQFSNVVKPRLKYATVRSLCGQADKWIAFVDIYQTYKNGKHESYKLQQATLQYGVHTLPPHPITSVLNIGSYSQTIDKSAKSVYIFNNDALNKDAAAGLVTINIDDGKTKNEIVLEQNMPDNVISADEAIKLMAKPYLDYVKEAYDDQDNDILLIDHSYIKLRSFLTETNPMKMSYTWELVLVHDSSFPCLATILRYNAQNKTTSISTREIAY